MLVRSKHVCAMQCKHDSYSFKVKTDGIAPPYLLCITNTIKWKNFELLK